MSTCEKNMITTGRHKRFCAEFLNMKISDKSTKNIWRVDIIIWPVDIILWSKVMVELCLLKNGHLSAIMCVVRNKIKFFIETGFTHFVWTLYGLVHFFNIFFSTTGHSKQWKSSYNFFYFSNIRYFEKSTCSDVLFKIKVQLSIHFLKSKFYYYIYYKQLHSDNCVVSNNLAVSKCNDNVFLLCFTCKL